MYLKIFLVGLVLLILLPIQSCREDFDLNPISSELRFSNDTISMDTIFNFYKSETYVLKVYSTEKKDREIPKIYLNKGSQSYYRVNVDGKSGINFENTPIRKNDSLFIFIDIFADEATTKPLYEDELVFEFGQSKKSIKLMSWIEKANLHQKDATISSTNWNADEAQVIDGNLTVTGELTIDKGTKIYFKKDASLTIANNAKLIVNGKLNEEVKFRSARHDNRYDSLPNQWKKIELSPNSTSTISYAKIIGADIGLQVNQSKLEINNSKIVNNQSYGILANNASITGYNLVMNNSNLATLAIENGGNYAFYHSTFANYFNFSNSAGPSYSLYLSNADSQGNSNPLTKALFGNCILYNVRSPNAIAFNNKDGVDFNYLFDTNIIHNVDTSAFDVTVNSSNFIGCSSFDPLFVNPNYKSNKLSLEENSLARLIVGNLNYSKLYPLDYNGLQRGTRPTIGAYQ